MFLIGEKGSNGEGQSGYRGVDKHFCTTGVTEFKAQDDGAITPSLIEGSVTQRRYIRQRVSCCSKATQPALVGLPACPSESLVGHE